MPFLPQLWYRVLRFCFFGFFFLVFSYLLAFVSAVDRIGAEKKFFFFFFFFFFLFTLVAAMVTKPAEEQKKNSRK